MCPIVVTVMKRTVETTLRAQAKCRGNRNWQRRYKQGVPRAAERRRLESATALVSSLPLLWLRAGNGSGAEMVLLLL